MNLEQRIEAFAKLGHFLRQFKVDKIEAHLNTESENAFFEAFKMQINRAQEFNGWFTKENVLKAIQSWGEALSEEHLKKWTSNYQFNDVAPKNVAIIMAGNIPLVGFHDFLSVLICNHNAIVKQSSNDMHFLPLITQYLIHVAPAFKTKIKFTNENLTNFDAVIATGSNNTARYFEYYFGKYPHIIRKNRNSVAILTGNESPKDLEKLGDDIFQYFGLGCRSVSKIFVPKNYNFDTLFNALFKFKDIINYKKYENNYDYNKAVYLMSLFNLKENGFLMLKEDESYASPIATLFYEYYDSIEHVLQKLEFDKDKIQCIVSAQNIKNTLNFGETQHPKLWDYADNVDTITFLLNI